MATPLIQLDRKQSAQNAARATTIGFVNLGCSKNQVDSEVMLGALAAGGFQLTGDARAAEVVVARAGLVSRLQRPLRERYASQGLDVSTGTPDQFKAFMAAETAKWHRVMKEAGIKPD